ncbi:MAG TPA: hypothetical protein VKB80_02200 [Kofleriaceae bacterium]|nr:hypothetical protein [Kofleriaceae bacterium]
MRKLLAKNRRRLALNAETVRTLTTSNMAQVIGGAVPSHDAGVCTESCRSCTCPPP